MSSPVRPPLTVTDGTTEVRPTNKIVFDAADGFSVTKNGNDARIDFTGGGGGTIGGSIADTQVAFGTAADTIGGDSSFTYDTSTNQLRIAGVSDNIAEFIIERTLGNTQTIGIENDSSASPIIRVNSAASNVKLMDFRNTIDDVAVTGGNSGFIFQHQINSNAGSVREFLRMITGDSSAYEVVFNEDSKNQDFRIESNAYTNMFALDGGLNKIFMGDGSVDNSLGLVQISVGDSTQNALTLISTDSDALSAPTMEFYRNSSSIEAGNQLGIIVFSGNNTSGDKETYGSINVQIDSGAASDSTSMQFKVKKSGTEVDNFRIRNGEVVVNEDSIDCDFRVEVNDNIYGFHVDAILETVGINTIGQADSDLTIMPSIHRSAAQSTAVLQLRNNNTSMPNDSKYGSIEFYNADASGAGVGASIDAMSNGSGRGGWFQFKTGTSGGSSTVKMGLDENGLLTVGSSLASTTLADNNPILQVQGSITSKCAIVTKTSATVDLSTRDSNELIGQLYVLTSTSAKTLTVPTTCTQGDWFRVLTTGANGMDIVASSGATLNGAVPANLTRDAQNEIYTVVAVATDKWICTSG